MPLDAIRVKKLLAAFEFKPLFIEELGWNLHNAKLEVLVDGQTYMLTATAEKCSMVAFLCGPGTDGKIPDNQTRRKIERQVANSIREHLIIFVDARRTEQRWQWVRRERGKPAACREHPYHAGQPGDSLIQKLQSLVISLKEEESITLPDVTGRVRGAFDVERVTKRFYDLFKDEHETFLKFLKGIPDEEMERWYVSVMLNRLMFIYFIQKKDFLNNDSDYLKNKLAQCRKELGKDRYYSEFLCPLFFEGFARRKEDRSDKFRELLGEVPYLNGGIFMPHQIEQIHGKTIAIPDKAFEQLFDFFDKYQWHLDERPLKRDNEINPDVLGYIFEKYINQKQMGAYYTKEDITDYISKNTIIPFLFDKAREKCKVAFEGERSIWRLLQEDPDNYIYPAVSHGIVWDARQTPPKRLERPFDLPSDIAAGISDVSKRIAWNKPAPSEYALPTEIWREVVARRKRYEEISNKIAAGEVRSVNDFITYNLDIRQFAQDVIGNCEGPELLVAFWKAIEAVTVLDPTCGSGAFLFAALNILEPFYEACLDRMQFFLEEWGEGGKKHHPNHYKRFSETLKRVDEHPNHKYFVLKSIVVNNLYGVDIMEEAIEICKLRLFLKLVAQIERTEDVEPLPDIDFNIRAGNTLVGYTSLEELKNSMEGDWVKQQALPRIEESALIADRAFQMFRKMQTECGMSSGEYTKAKKELRDRLTALEDELNKYLAEDCGINPKKRDDFSKWLKSHRPFHWYIEFYGTTKNGGFDVIIGNPPFVENTPSKVSYVLKRQSYSTLDCGNLYAFVAERSLHLCNKIGSFSFIMPAASICTPRMSPLESEIRNRFEMTWTSVWDERPSKLFDGVDHQLTIHIGRGNGPVSRTCITTMRHWAAEEREYLFSTTSYLVLDNNQRIAGVPPKIGCNKEIGLLRKIFTVPYLLSGYLMVSAGGAKIFYRNAGGRYWRLVKRFQSYFRSDVGATATSTEKTFNVAKEHAPLFVALFSSSFFYWFWRIGSNCRHFTDREMTAFPVAKTILEKRSSDELSDLCERFESRLKETKQRQTTENKRSGKVVQDFFFVSTAKPILDEIDRVLAKHYGFTDEELDFIINYDIKYRMGQDSGEEES